MSTIDKNAQTHLAFLDGMRGLAALYVVFHHVYINLSIRYEVPGADPITPYFKLLHPLAFGHYAVDLFIVLSGYCLMLPVLRNQGQLRGGFSGYLKRRARRILPPYYIALVVSLLFLVGQRVWDGTILLPSRENMLTHTLLLHNLVAPYTFSINAPLWSVATEWQIYFLFPLLLLFWRKWGSVGAVAVGFALGYALYFLVPGGLVSASPWFIGLFALGMAGAAFQTAPPHIYNWVRKIPWGTLALVCTGLLVLVGLVGRGWFKTHPQVIDPLFGLAALSLILHGVHGKPSVVMQICNSRGAVALGAFSYSLYLTHYPLLDAATLVLRRANLPMEWQALVLLLLFVPVSIGFAFLFYLLFERPFIVTRSKPAVVPVGVPEELKQSSV